MGRKKKELEKMEYWMKECTICWTKEYDKSISIYIKEESREEVLEKLKLIGFDLGGIIPKEWK